MDTLSPEKINIFHVEKRKENTKLIIKKMMYTRITNEIRKLNFSSENRSTAVTWNLDKGLILKIGS